MKKTIKIIFVSVGTILMYVLIRLNLSKTSNDGQLFVCSLLIHATLLIYLIFEILINRKGINFSFKNTSFAKVFASTLILLNIFLYLFKKIHFGLNDYSLSILFLILFVVLFPFFKLD